MAGRGQRSKDTVYELEYRLNAVPQKKDRQHEDEADDADSDGSSEPVIGDPLSLKQVNVCT